MIYFMYSSSLMFTNVDQDISVREPCEYFAAWFTKTLIFIVVSHKLHFSPPGKIAP